MSTTSPLKGDITVAIAPPESMSASSGAGSSSFTVMSATTDEEERVAPSNHAAVLVDELGFFLTASSTSRPATHVIGPYLPEDCRPPSDTGNVDWWRGLICEYYVVAGEDPSVEDASKDAGTSIDEVFHRMAGDDRRHAAVAPSVGVWRRELLRRARKAIRCGPVSPAARRLVWPFLGGCFATGSHFRNGSGGQPTPAGGSKGARPGGRRGGMLVGCIWFDLPSVDELQARTVPPELLEVMYKDLGRTLPTHSLFRSTENAACPFVPPPAHEGETSAPATTGRPDRRPTSLGQYSLLRILRAYCVLDREVGYCQGMGFLVAVLLLHMDEAEAFGTFVQMMQGRQFGLRRLYLAGFPLLSDIFVVFKQLMAVFLPELSQHLEDLSIDVAFFASHWFLTLFAYQLPVPLVGAIWDRFFSEGWKAIFQVAIALLQLEAPKLLTGRMEDVLMTLKTVHEGKDGADILRRAWAVPVRERDLVLLR